MRCQSIDRAKWNENEFHAIGGNEYVDALFFSCSLNPRFYKYLDYSISEFKKWAYLSKRARANTFLGRPLFSLFVIVFITESFSPIYINYSVG